MIHDRLKQKRRSQDCLLFMPSHFLPNLPCKTTKTTFDINFGYFFLLFSASKKIKLFIFFFSSPGNFTASFHGNNENDMEVKNKTEKIRRVIKLSDGRRKNRKFFTLFLKLVRHLFFCLFVCLFARPFRSDDGVRFRLCHFNIIYWRKNVS
jgi:hypothetical protein